MNSMTGYGYAEKTIEGIGAEISCEIRSINSRFLDLAVNIPPYMNAFEGEIRKTVSARVARGKVDVFIRVKTNNAFQKVSVNIELAREYLNAIQDLSFALQERKGESARDRLLSRYFNDAPVPLGLIIAREGVLSVSNDYDTKSIWNCVKGALEGALDGFLAERAREGDVLKRALLLKLGILDECVDFFERYQDEMEARFAARLTARFKQLVPGAPDNTLIMNEVALQVVKYTITEEVVRLKSHLAAMHNLINSDTAPGKKLDFICQEAFREVNTLGSKNQILEVGERVITAKSALEDIKEQCRNIE